MPNTFDRCLWPQKTFLSVSCRSAAAVAFLLAILLSSSEATSVEQGEEPMLPSESGVSSLVPDEEGVSDFDSRLVLAQTLAQDKNRRNDAVAHFRELLKANPNHQCARIGLAGLLARMGRHKEAAELIQSVLDGKLHDVQLLADMADIEAALGHAKLSRLLYQRAMAEAKGKEINSIALRYASTMQAWGDFYTAETIFRNALAGDENNVAIRLKLANLLAGMQRYDEAEGMYRKLLPVCRTDALIGLAEVKFLKKSFDQSAKLASEVPADSPSGLAALSLQAGALLEAKEYDQALNLFEELSQNKSQMLEGLLGLGATLRAMGRVEAANAAYNKALDIEPDNPIALLAIHGLPTSAAGKLVDKLPGKPTSAAALTRWAEALAAKGLRPAATECYRAALRSDPSYFPAVIGLAGVLAGQDMFDESIGLYNDLAEEYPSSSKIRLELARVLAWSKRYQQAIGEYDELHRINPDDPVPVMEKARTAMWAKDFKLARATYRQLQEPPVDRLLLERLRNLPQQRMTPALKQEEDRLEATLNNQDSPCDGYESLRFRLDNDKLELSQADRQWLDDTLAELQPTFQIQKTAGLEERAKSLAWDRRWSQALSAYEALLRNSPGNEEAAFEKAQMESQLGLNDDAVETYRKLLYLDPNHRQAAEAKTGLESLRNPEVSTAYSFWREKGYGDLSQMQRQRIDTGAALPLTLQHTLRVTENHWFEKTLNDDRTYQSDGFTLRWDGVFNKLVSGSGGWTRKFYETSDLNPLDTGFADLAFNLDDYARINAGWELANEIYNTYGLHQGVQSNSGYVKLFSAITRKLEFDGEIRGVYYTDHNTSYREKGALSYALTDHPHMLKVSMFGEHRNTEHTSRYIYRGNTLVNIIYPYWSPNNYTSGGGALEWRHDLSKQFYRGADQHYYFLRGAAAAASDNNPWIEFEGGWHLELSHHWTIELKALVHRSDQWNAEGAWLSLGYRF
ncbi:MAG: tetratricopeptide repeat protein [Planctomycetaceae bacterium]|nr:MAG: tetratricopeptide repeat protein [Planctomycetaceae bacterium]